MRVHVCTYVRAHMYVASTWLSFVSSSSNIQGVGSFVDLFRPRRPRDLRDRMRLSQPLLLKCQPHLQVVYPVVANEALKTESWRYNHNISFGGNTYAQACLEAQRQQPQQQTTHRQARNLSWGNSNTCKPQGFVSILHNFQSYSDIIK
jgi:hypothetical protein